MDHSYLKPSRKRPALTPTLSQTFDGALQALSSTIGHCHTVRWKEATVSAGDTEFPRNDKLNDRTQRLILSASKCGCTVKASPWVRCEFFRLAFIRSRFVVQFKLPFDPSKRRGTAQGPDTRAAYTTNLRRATIASWLCNQRRLVYNKRRQHKWPSILF